VEALIVAGVIFVIVALVTLTFVFVGRGSDEAAEIEEPTPDPEPDPEPEVEVEVEAESEAPADPVAETDIQQLTQARVRMSARRPPQPPRGRDRIVAPKPAEAPEAASQPEQAHPEPEIVEAQEEATERLVRVVRPTGSVIVEGDAAIEWLTERGATRLRSYDDDDLAGLILSDVKGITEVNPEGGVLSLTYNPDPPPARAPERPAAQQPKAAPKATPQGKKPSDPSDPRDPASPAFLKWNDPRRLAMEAEDE